GAEPRGARDLTCRTEIVTGEKARARRRDAVREHRPHHNPAAGGADIQPELGDRAVLDLLRSRRLGGERAGDRLLRADDEAHAGRDVTSQDTGTHALGGRWLGARNGERQRCRPDGVTKHMDPPFLDFTSPTGLCVTDRPYAKSRSSCQVAAKTLDAP